MNTLVYVAYQAICIRYDVFSTEQLILFVSGLIFLALSWPVQIRVIVTVYFVFSSCRSISKLTDRRTESVLKGKNGLS